MPTYSMSSDPIWTGVGNRQAWVEEYKPYRIHWLNGAQGVDGADAVLDCQPHPTEYRPAQAVASSGNGATIRVGWATAVWHFDRLTAGQMKQLLDARDNAITLNHGFVFIVTATDLIDEYTDAVSGFKTVRPTYYKFRCAIWDITYTTAPNYTYTDVTVEFRHLELV